MFFLDIMVVEVVILCGYNWYVIVLLGTYHVEKNWIYNQQKTILTQKYTVDGRNPALIGLIGGLSHY